MRSKQKDVICKFHGPAPVALACRHVTAGVACGFHILPGDSAHPDAWCDRCDEQLAGRGEWTIEMARQSDMLVTCVYCYDLAKQRNRDLPAYARGKRAELTEDERRSLCDLATERVAAIQEAARAKWKFDLYERWDFDESARTLSFTDTNHATLFADVRLVGAFAPEPRTFTWSWASHEDTPLLVGGVDGLRTFGEVRGLPHLAASSWLPCSLADAWELTALAGYLLGCDGVYRADFDDSFWFMLLANWRHSRRGQTIPGGFGS